MNPITKCLAWAWTLTQSHFVEFGKFGTKKTLVENIHQKASQYHKYFLSEWQTKTAETTHVKALGARLTTNAGRDAKMLCPYPSSAFPTQSRLQPSAARTFVEALHRCKVLSTVDQGTCVSDCARWLTHLTQNGCPRVTMRPELPCLPQRDSGWARAPQIRKWQCLTHIKSNHDYESKCLYLNISKNNCRLCDIKLPNCR